MVTAAALVADEVGGGTRVYSFAAAALAAIVESALTSQVVLPGKQYVTTGQAVYDCEQVAVTALTLTTGLPGATVPVIPSEMVCLPSWSMAMELAIVRCGPKINPKTGGVAPSDIDAVCQQSSADAGVLMGAVDILLSTRFGNMVASVSMSPPGGDMVATVARVTGALP